MAQPLVQPNPRDLVPPILACLPTSFASPQPPPALLPLLSPVLRQRVQLLSATSTSWLPLLCWDAERASRLQEVVENIQVEPHPASGELELEDPEAVAYRRLDPETLHVRFDLGDFKLAPIYLWCMTDGASGGSGWMLSELRALDDKEDGTEWRSTISEADEAANSRTTTNAQPSVNAFFTRPAQEPTPPGDEDDDDDAYWAAYDRTPGRTPSKRSPAPVQSSSSLQLPNQSELDYFARYAAEVQPAMDAHDPEEEMVEAGGSTLNGNSLVSRAPQTESTETTNIGGGGYDSSLPPPQINGHPEHQDQEDAQMVNGGHDDDIAQPRASSVSSGSVGHLERVATSTTRAEIAIKQHISSDMKSLYRMARMSGIDRAEFERLVRTELDCLSMMELDD